jgi:hypothetical protein
VSAGCYHELDEDDTCDKCGLSFVTTSSSPLIPLDEVVRVVEGLTEYAFVDGRRAYLKSSVLTAIKELGK